MTFQGSDAPMRHAGIDARPSSLFRLNAKSTVAVALLGCGLVLLGAFLSTRIDSDLSLGLALAAAAFVLAATCGFLAYPHLTVAVTVVVFALVPLLRWFTWPEVGGVKDLFVLAAAAAAVIVFAVERRRPDTWILALAAALLGLYALNLGGDHGAEWAHGIRLVGEPLLLLLAGLTLPEPRRTFRWATGALIATATLVAAYGIVQQVVGKWTLVESWGYSFTEQVRTVGDGQLRSFGTLDDPFAYAALLTFGIAAALFWLRRAPLAWGTILIMLAGLAFSFVRTSVVVVFAFACLVVWRQGHARLALAGVGVAVILAAAVLALGGATGSEANSAQEPAREADRVPGQEGEGSEGGDIGARLSEWKEAIGDDPMNWVIGRGVGEVGTAADRARNPAIPDAAEGKRRTEWVDSGYVAAIADVGVIGLALLLGLLGRLTVLAARSARQGATAGWVALALMVALIADALTRDSFTGFPTAFLCLFLVGIALAAARNEADSASARAVAAPG